MNRWHPRAGVAWLDALLVGTLLAAVFGAIPACYGQQTQSQAPAKAGPAPLGAQSKPPGPVTGSTSGSSAGSSRSSAGGIAANSAAAPIAQAALAASSADFAKTADQVLEQMSEILHLPVKKPLKKSLRSRQQIRDYLVQQEKEDKEPKKRYADQRALEAFGLIPKGFPLESFLLDLLTDQIAGLYDSKAREFYIADWIAPEDQKPVMAHELTHALDDQYYHIDAWQKAARPNDDAESAREAVLEGSALAAMFDYSLAPDKMSVRNFGDIASLIDQQALEEAEKDPVMEKAPPFLRDDLLFPYVAGAGFTQQFLKATSGWADFHKVFENPPVSTQQILHPEMYLAGVKPPPLAMPKLKPLLPHGWKELDQNVMGEYGLKEVLKQFLGADAAARLSPDWAADRYSISESGDKQQTLLIYLLRLQHNENAKSFFVKYDALLRKKYPAHTAVAEQPALLEWQTSIGAVELQCREDECLAVEGADVAFFRRLIHALRWPATPSGPAVSSPPRGEGGPSRTIV
jgi:hypothetical protein